MRCTLLFFLLIISVFIAGAQDWELAKDKNGIQIYTRPVDHSAFKEFRGVVDMNVPISALVAALHDIDAYPEWMPNAASSEVLSERSDTQVVYRLVTDAPWPVQDRDGIYGMHFESKPGSAAVLIRLEALPDRVPTDPDYIRIRTLTGYWRLHPREDGSVQVTYQVLTDPAGNVPVWMVNATVVSQPFQTLSALRQRAQLPKYQDREFSFLD